MKGEHIMFIIVNEDPGQRSAHHQILRKVVEVLLGASADLHDPNEGEPEALAENITSEERMWLLEALDAAVLFRPLLQNLVEAHGPRAVKNAIKGSLCGVETLREIQPIVDGIILYMSDRANDDVRKSDLLNFAEILLVDVVERIEDLN